MSDPAAEDETHKLKQEEDAQALFSLYLEKAKQQQLEARKGKGFVLLNHNKTDIDAGYERLRERWFNTFNAHEDMFTAPSRKRQAYASTLKGELELLADQTIRVKSMIMDYEKQASGTDVIKVGQFRLAFASQLKEGFKEFQEDKRCFIATASFHENHPNVIHLRSYRDKILKKSSIGQRCIKQYYIYSPNIAKQVKSNLSLKQLSRVLVLGMVGLTKIHLQLTKQLNQLKEKQ